MAVPLPSPSPSRKSGLTRSHGGSFLSSDITGSSTPNNTTTTRGLLSSNSRTTSSNSQLGGDYMVRTSSAISSSSSSSIQLPNNTFISPSNSNSYSNSNFASPSPSHSHPNARPGIGRRRSTDASTSVSGGGLDYYWSSLAGIGASSSSSSLGISSSPNSIQHSNSNYMLNIPHSDTHQQGGTGNLSTSPIGSFERDSKNVGILINEEFTIPHDMGMSFSPSSIESFGHKIREAKSTGNLKSPTKSSFNSDQMRREMESLSLDHHNHNNIGNTRKMDSPREEKTPRQPDYPSPKLVDYSTNPLSLSTSFNPNPALNPNSISSSTKALNINYPSKNDLTGLDSRRTANDLSPGGWSENSTYSNNDDSQSAPQSAISNSSHLSAPVPWKLKRNNSQGSDSGHSGAGDESSESNYSPIGFKIPGKFDFEDDQLDNNSIDRRGLFGIGGNHTGIKGEDENVNVNVDEPIGTGMNTRASVQSTATYRQNHLGHQQDEEENTNYRTPIAPANQQDRPDIHPPRLSLNQNFNTTSRSQHSSPSGSAHGGGMSTPKRSPNSRNGAGSANSHYTPTSATKTAHLGLGFDVSQFGSGIGSGAISPARTSSSPGHAQDHEHQYETSSAPRSAPANKSDFTELDSRSEEHQQQQEHADPLKSSDRRSTLPAINPSGGVVETTISQSKENLLSPDKYANRSGAVTPVREGSGERRGSTPSPNRSPEPPPRSALRQLPNATNIDTLISNSPSRRPSSPQSVTQTLPVITHTPHSPMPSPDRSKASEQDTAVVNINKPQPKRPDRSPDRQYSPIFSSSATINDLTDILGGAIDAIGLIDSRDTPPPTISEPNKKEKPVNMTLKLEPPAELLNSNDIEKGPMTPTSLPTRGASLPGPGPTPLSQDQSLQQQQQHPSAYNQIQNRPGHSRKSTQPELRQKASSIFSFASTSKEQIQSPTLSITVRPWPSAMLYGNIKSLKHSGDRAKGYARAINELSRSETGLKEWCIASVSQINRVGAPTKSSALSSLGVRANSVPSAIPLPYQLTTYDPTPHQRNVSAGSEFPMRADSYTAREISQRILDPEDQPTSLPPNLPYPQLQAQQAGFLGGGLKPSQSMQSVASFASSKKGFFSAISNKKSSHKKDSLSLGPPSNTQNISSPTSPMMISSAGVGGSASSGAGSSSVNRKDIRGLPISGPRSSSPQKLPHSSDTGGNGRGPIGPRGPRLAGGSGSFTPPPMPATSHRSSIEMIPGGRSSLDTGLSKISQPIRNDSRGSLDGHVMTASSSVTSIPPPRGGSLSGGHSTPIPPSRLGGSSTTGTPKEEEIRQMSDILPHVERSVLRSYLGRYGDTMTAIGAYLEDEKNGTVIR